MRAELGPDSPLLEKVMQDYPPYGKRILIDNNWYRMLKRPNVDLVTEPIVRVRTNGVETQDGTVWPADALVFATGFQASKMLAPMEIRGRDGKEIHSVWGVGRCHGLFGHHGAGLSEFFHPAGPEYRTRAWRQCDLHGRVSDAPGDVVPARDGGAPQARHRSARRGERADTREPSIDLHAGLVWTHPGSAELVQECQRPCVCHLALAAGGVLAHDLAVQRRGLRLLLNQRTRSTMRSTFFTMCKVTSACDQWPRVRNQVEIHVIMPPIDTAVSSGSSTSEHARFYASLEQLRQPHTKFLAQIEKRPRFLLLEILLFAQIYHQIFLVRDDDGGDLLDDQAQHVARCEAARQRLVERRQRTRDADVTDGIQDLALVLEI